jgi:diguanylate cyclase (GGDEF)-like protein
VLPASVLDTIASAQREVFALYEIAQTFSSSLNLKDMLAIIASKLEAILPFTTCVINLVETLTGDVVARHVVGEHIDFFKLRRYRPGVGVTGWVVANKRPMYNTAPDLDFTEVERDMATRYSIAAVFPLVKGDDALGTISLYSSELHEYSVDHIRLMEIVAQQASDAINNAIIYEDAKTSAMTDALTGLLNIRAFHSHCDQEISNAARFSQPLTVLNMDLDGFKRINDNYGHQVGDRILVQVSQVLRRQFREADILTRYAGDEFMAILPGIDRRTASALIERIQRSIETFHYKLRDGKSAALGISIGSASYPEDGRTMEDLVAQSDKRMYENKKVRTHSGHKSGQAEVVRFRQQGLARKS